MLKDTEKNHLTLSKKATKARNQERLEHQRTEMEPRDKAIRQTLLHLGDSSPYKIKHQPGRSWLEAGKYFVMLAQKMET